MRVVLWISAVFGALSVAAWTAVFVLVKTGTVVATGAPPYGVLQQIGLVGALIAFVAHSLYGMLIGLTNIAVPVLSLLLLLFGLASVIRRRRPWFTPLAGPALWFGASLLGDFATTGIVWLGSVSDWDAPASTAALAGTMLTSTGQLPLWGFLIWRWSNREPLRQDDLDHRYWSNVRDTATAVGSIGSTVVSLALLVAEIELLIYAWQRGGVIGVILALVFGGIVYGLLTAARSLIEVCINAVAMPSISMPVAAIVTVLSRSRAEAAVSARTQEAAPTNGNQPTTPDLMTELQASLNDAMRQANEANEGNRRRKVAVLKDALRVVGCVEDEINRMIVTADQATLDEVAERIATAAPIATWSAEEQRIFRQLAELLLTSPTAQTQELHNP
jgi:hypothetical protein